MERHLADAYRNWQAPLLRPPVRPPGFSRLPDPQRTNTMSTPAPALPPFVGDFGAISPKLRRLYVPADGGGFRLTVAGRVLSKLRAAAAADPLALSRAAPRAKLTKLDWRILVGASVAGPEREALLKAAAVKHIEVEG
jgi:hypothetical protein